VSLGFYAVNFLCFWGKRVNIQGVSTDEATRKCLHKLWRNSQIFVFHMHYTNVCVKFDDFFQTARERKSQSKASCQKNSLSESAQYAFLDHSNTLVFSDFVKIGILSKYLHACAIRTYSVCAEKTIWGNLKRIKRPLRQ